MYDSEFRIQNSGNRKWKFVLVRTKCIGY